MRHLLATTAGIAVLALIAALHSPAEPTRPRVEQLAGPSFIDAATTALAQASAMECQWDQPECTRTARERYRKWKRGGYGYTPQWRLHYARKIKRAILNQAALEWGRKYNTRMKRREEWNDYTDNPRMCIAYSAMCCFIPDESDYCKRRWVRDPKRLFVKDVLVCAGQIALARIGVRGASAGTKKTIVGGTGALCAWDKMP